MVDRKLEKNLEFIDDRSKTQEELIAELAQLRHEVAALKRSSPSSTKIIPPRIETLSEIGLAEFSQSYRLMLVDDDELFRTSFRRYLTNKPHKNCHVVEFNNAEDALVWCREQTPDIALIDYRLTGMNGLEFVAALRQEGLHKQIPCIMMTSYQDEALLVEAIKSGVKDFLDKARITPEGLNRAIANVLQKKLFLQQQELQRDGQNLVNAIAYHSVDNSSELEQVFQYTVAELRRLLHCDRVFIYQLLPDDRGKITTESVINETFSLLGKEIQNNYFTENPEWKNWYFQGKMKSVSDVLTDSPNSENYQQCLKQIQIRSFLTIPIFQDKNLWGLITANQCIAPREWTTTEIELLNQIALQIGLAIQTVSLNQKAEKEIQERQKFEKIINEISIILVTKVGENFFQVLVEYLCRILEVDYVCLAKIESPQRAKTLVVCHQQEIIDNFEIDITGQPCSEICKAEPHSVISYQNNAQKLFPKHKLIQSGNIRAFLGIPLVNQSQKAIGLLTILHSSPLKNPQLAEKILRIVASRAGAELERQQIETELHELNLCLEERVKKRTTELSSVYERLQNELEEREQIELEKQKSEEFYSQYLETELIERQRIERALSESEIRYRRIVETASEGIWQLDEENKTVFVNPKMAEILGYSVEEMLEKSILDFLLETDKAPLDYLLEQREYSLIHSYDIQFCHRDGSILWAMISSRPIFDDSGEYLGCLKMVTDISDRKQSEAILKEFNRRWRSVLDNIQMIVVQLDRQGVVQYINPFFLKTYQFDLEEVMGENWLKKFIPARLRPKIDTVFKEILYHELHSYYENPILIKPNEERIISWRTCSLKDNRGRASGIIAIGEDVTEKHYLEKMKSEFVSIVSHELKTPLTAIQASLSLLDGKFIDPSSEKGEESISIATEGVDRLARLVDDILDLERLRTGKLTILKTDCNIQDIIRGAIAHTQELVKRTNIKIEVFSESFSCYADGDRVIQVLTNLISNSIKFSPHQSTIELSIKQKDPDSSHEIDAKPHILFAIRDRGRGIPSKNLESIFERFQQVDASDSREKGGTGLGLAISRDIVEQHGGKIWAESVLEEGTTFFFTIPIKSMEVMSDDI